MPKRYFRDSWRLVKNTGDIAVLPTLAYNESIDGSLAVHEADGEKACCIEDQRPRRL
jgi:hypothetical protein